MEWRSVGLCKDVIPGSGTPETNHEPGNILAAAVLAQHLERSHIDRDKPLAVLGLGGFETQPLLGFLETALDADPGVVEIDVPPLQGAQLTAPQTARQRQGYDRQQNVALETGQGLGDLVGAQDLDFFGRSFGCLGLESGIASEQFEVDRVLQRLSQDPVGVPNRAGRQRIAVNTTRLQQLSMPRLNMSRRHILEA